MPISRLTALRLTALALGAAAATGAAVYAAGIIEERSETAVAEALSEAGYDWVELHADGLKAILGGEAPDEVTRFRALTVAGKVVNPANLRDAMHVAPPADLPPPPYSVEILSSGGDITLHGLIPGGNAAKARLMAELEALSPRGKVSDLVTVVPEPAAGSWDAMVALAVETVGTLKDARVLVTGTGFEVSGLSTDRMAAEALEKRLAAALPGEVELDLDLKLPRPVISPFTARFRIDERGPHFESCAAESAAGKARIENAAAAAGATGPFSCTEGLGAPDPSWSRAVTEGIIALQQLGRGTITFSDLSVTLVGPFDASERLRESVIAGLEAALPAVFRLEVVNPDDSTAADRPAAPLVFSATRSPEGTAILRGLVPDAVAKATIESFAKARLGNADLHFSLDQNGSLPAGWQVAVLAGIDALSQLRNGAVSITPDATRIYGITSDPEAEAGISQALSAALGPTAKLDVDLTYRAPVLPPEEVKPSAQECVSRINEILAARKINFAPGSVELDAHGEVTVGRIAEILDECADAEMEIGGHTDSQGSEDMNLELSGQRATAVLNALSARRVLTGNLSARGYGETEPVADNGTEDGREANRRIAFRLVGASAEAAEAEAARTAAEAALDGPDKAAGTAASSGEAEAPDVAEAETEAETEAEAASDQADGEDMTEETDGQD